MAEVQTFLLDTAIGNSPFLHSGTFIVGSLPPVPKKRIGLFSIISGHPIGFSVKLKPESMAITAKKLKAPAPDPGWEDSAVP